MSRVHEPTPFRPADLELASVFASQALLALENVSLVRKAVHNERLAFAGRLAAELSHEVANPAAFVISNLEFLLEELRSTSGPGSAERLGAARDALEGARRIARVAGDMRAALRGGEKQPATCALPDPARFAPRMSAGEGSTAR